MGSFAFNVNKRRAACPEAPPVELTWLRDSHQNTGMHPLAKRIALLSSAFCLVIGLFLLAFNLQFISAGAMNTALNLWPLLLVIAGVMLVVDSAKKGVSAQASQVTTQEFALPIWETARSFPCACRFPTASSPPRPPMGHRAW